MQKCIYDSKPILFRIILWGAEINFGQLYCHVTLSFQNIGGLKKNRLKPKLCEKHVGGMWSKTFIGTLKTN